MQNTIIVLVVPAATSGEDIVGSGNYWTPNDTLLMLYSGEVAGHFWPMDQFTGTQTYGTIPVATNVPVVLSQVNGQVVQALSVFTSGVENSLLTLGPSREHRTPPAHLGGPSLRGVPRLRELHRGDRRGAHLQPAPRPDRAGGGRGLRPLALRTAVPLSLWSGSKGISSPPLPVVTIIYRMVDTQAALALRGSTSAPTRKNSVALSRRFGAACRRAASWRCAGS